MLERCVHYDGIDGEIVAELAKAAESWGMKALRAVNAKVLEGDAGQEAALGRWRMNFGMYFYAEPMETQSEEMQGDGT
jgi:hypothetical protein